MKLLAVAISALLGGCAMMEPHPEWEPKDTALEVGFQVLNALDARTTQRIADNAYAVETSALTRAVLEPNPSANETAVYFAVTGLSHYLISRALPPKWRKWFQAGTIGYSATVLERNCDLGLCERQPTVYDRVGDPIICVGDLC